MMRTCLQKKVVDKLNRVFAKKKIRIEYDLAHKRCCISDGTQEDAGWSTLGRMLLGEDDYFSIFDFWTAFESDDEAANVSFVNRAVAELGMRCLAECKSWEELLLRLEIMFPDV